MLIENLDVLELPAKLFPEPHCNHQVRLHSEKGPLVKRQVSIGETIVHIWSCSYGITQNNSLNTLRNVINRDRIYCMIVRNCTVSNQNRQTKSSNIGVSVVEIVDEFGCSNWPDILPQIKYQGDLKATLEVQAFALEYDNTAMNFSCQITLLLKNNGRCRRPQCLKTIKV
uniref:ZP domain-containing protein n=1 Tax=Meloidogyne hapla TaxID=6305 RepID=A0A1I8B0Q4_MELHA